MRPAWIGVDWQADKAYAWIMSGDGKVLSETHYASPNVWDIAGPWADAGIELVVTGTPPGSEKAHQATPVPCPPDHARLVRLPGAGPRLRVSGGLSQARPTDMMQGAEAALAGLLETRPDYDGIVLWLGDTAVWAQISAGEVTGFKSTLSPELFRLLSTGSVLRHSLDAEIDDNAYEDAVRHGLSTPQAMAGRFFGIRAETLLNGLSGDKALARLLANVIAPEVDALRPLWQDRPLTLIGRDPLVSRYRVALGMAGADVVQADPGPVTWRGLARLRIREGAMT